MSAGPDDFLRGKGRPTFGAALQKQKQGGCNILIVGDVADKYVDELSTELLGEPIEGPRSRVFGLFGRNAKTAEERIAVAGYSHPAQIVTSAEFARSATTTDDSGCWDSRASRNTGFTQVDDEGLCSLQHALVDAIERAENKHGGFQTGQLRVCLDSLRPLLDTYETECVRDFLSVVTQKTANKNGMGHYVLQAPRDSEAVKSIESLFDIVLSLSTENGEQKQEWYIREFEHTWNWPPEE